LQVTFDGQAWEFQPSRAVLVGRAPRCDITVADDRVSRRHLELRPGREGWEMADLGSRNGTWVNGSARSRAVLHAESDLVVRVGDLEGPELVLRCGPAVQPDATGGRLVIGRDPACDVVVDDPLVSRRHAVINRGQQAVLEDLDSFNGTYRNGHQISAPMTLRDGDSIGVGNQLFLWTGRGLTKAPPRRHALDARHLTVTTATGAVLLDDVSVNLPAGSVTAVIGPSGAGKSTLMGALTGLRPAGEGNVIWAGRDLYAEYDQLRFLVGLVPQEDIIHRQLTVARALRFAARLRLPPDIDREIRIDEVLGEVGLTAQKDQRIDSLSGGQLKRTSIALELLTAPRLLFLDEPTSGLDPGLDRQVMVELRALADAGRVVVVVTHSVLALDVCDRVLVLAPGGRVAFFGPPAMLLPFFGVQDYPAAFDALKDPAWVQRYAQSSTRAAFVGHTGLAQIPAPAEETPTPPRPAPLRQLWTLTRRNLAVAAADRMFLILLVTMPVILALMAHAFPGDAGLSMAASGGKPGEAQQRLLVLIVGAALMGSALSIRDLVTERPIYRREHAVGLHPGAYLASKVLVLSTLVAAQSTVFTLLALYRVRGPDTPVVLPSARLEIAAAVAAVAVAMTVAALAVSAAARSADQTMPALVALVMAQLVFCGGLFALTGRAGLEQLSWLLPARFGYAAGAATIGLQPPSVPGADPLFEPTAEQWLFDLGALTLQTGALIVLTALLLARSVVRSGPR
jgi:ABC-type multidrug transport system ATPase subunit/pSer/pThr/pTyr-binding forkhead associated (FHA) protein